MKKYTVKDFLKLNSPCYGCGKKINLRMGSDVGDLMGGTVYLKMSVTPAYYSIPLSATYNDNLKLLIEPRTNKFTVSNGERFVSYIKKHNLFVMVYCDNCGTAMISQYLEFNLIGGYIKPVGLSAETIVLQDKNNRYTIVSQYPTDQTKIVVASIKDGAVTSASNLELPLLPHYRFKDKQHFMSKIKTYLLFS